MVIVISIFYITEMPAAGLPTGNEMHNYLAREEDRSGHPMVKDTKQIGSAYDRYLQSGVTFHPLVFANLYYSLFLGHFH
jgi:hypothetical protein